MNNKKQNHSDYQKNYQKGYRQKNSEEAKKYREANKEKMREYQFSYRKNSLFKEIINDENLVCKSRFYICKLGEDRVKIGATFVGSNRIYHLKWSASLLGFDLNPLYFYDCNNREIIQLIERKIKQLYCDSDLGLNKHSFKKEVSHIINLKEIKNFIQEILDNSGYPYSFTKL